MGVTPAQLAELYPRLYHMAELGSWESVRRHGLLSTSALLTLFEIEGEERRRIEHCRRDTSVPIRHLVHGRAMVRDQKAIIESKLLGALQDCTLQEWYSVLNSRVFFWLTVERLRRFLHAKEYRGEPHAVLTLDTLTLATAYEDRITLSPMNTGNTLPIAHPRGLKTFQRMRDYPFQERLRLGTYSTVVELAVDGGIKDILDYTIRAEEMVADTEEDVRVLALLYAR